MKTKIGILTVLFALGICFGCSKDEAEKIVPKIVKANTDFAAPGGTGVIELSVDPSAVSVTTGGEWCAATINGAVVNLTVQENSYMTGRAALVAVSYPDAEDILVPVTQAGGSIAPVYQESWEDYDGDISLSGWTIQKDDASSITWGLTDYWGGWYGDLAPTSGKYMALIEYEESAGSILPQDQWLISPAFTVKNHNSFYFDYAHAPIWMYYGPIGLDFDNPMFTLKAKISVDNGATWTELFDAFENNKGRYDDDNIFDYLTPIWETITVDLTAYAGKTVKLAFHSKGVFPDCNFIDNVSVGIQKEFANPPVRSSVQKNLGLSFSGKNGISFEKKAGKTVKKFID